MTTWQEDYAALLARVKGPGLIEPVHAAKMSGLELLQGIASGTVPYPPINEFKIHLVRPLTEKTGPVGAEGRIVASGRRTATAEGRLTDEQGRLYSHGTTTCMIFDLDGAQR